MAAPCTRYAVRTVRFRYAEVSSCTVAQRGMHSARSVLKLLGSAGEKDAGSSSVGPHNAGRRLGTERSVQSCGKGGWVYLRVRVVSMGEPSYPGTEIDADPTELTHFKVNRCHVFFVTAPRGGMRAGPSVLRKTARQWRHQATRPRRVA